MEATYWDAEMMLHCYIYDYLLKKNLHVTAQTFLEEAKVPKGPVSIDDSSSGFLFEWWSVFSDVYFRQQSNYEVQQAINMVLPLETIDQEMDFTSLPLYLPRQVEYVKIPNSPQTDFMHPQMNTPAQMELFSSSNLHMPKARLSSTGQDKLIGWPFSLTDPTSEFMGQEQFNSLSVPFNQNQQIPSFTLSQDLLYSEPLTATCTDIRHPMLNLLGNVFSKINDKNGGPSVPKDQNMVMSNLEEEDQSRGQQSKKFTSKEKELLYPIKDSSQPGDTIHPSNVSSSAMLGSTSCAEPTSRNISECFGTTDKRMFDNSVKDGESSKKSEPMNEAMDVDNGLAKNDELEPSPEACDDTRAQPSRIEKKCSSYCTKMT